MLRHIRWVWTGLQAYAARMQNFQASIVLLSMLALVLHMIFWIKMEIFMEVAFRRD